VYCDVRPALAQPASPGATVRSKPLMERSAPRDKKDEKAHGGGRGGRGNTPSNWATTRHHDKHPTSPSLWQERSTVFPLGKPKRHSCHGFWTSSPRQKLQASGRPTKKFRTFSVLLCNNKLRAPCLSIVNQRLTATPCLRQRQMMPRHDDPSGSKKAWTGPTSPAPKARSKHAERARS
jgi:hypothetical protein